MKKIDPQENPNEVNTAPETAEVIPMFSVIPGGKGPPTDNWLFNLPIGTVFLARNKTNATDFVLKQFHLVGKINARAIVVLDNFYSKNPDGDFYIIDSIRFCELHECAGIQKEGNGTFGDPSK